MIDFSASMYRQLCNSLVKIDYKSLPLGEYSSSPHSADSPVVFLRHDVDRVPATAVTLAEIEKELGLTATYFFRCIKGAFVPSVIEKVSDLGMEVGYHYECLDRAHGNYEQAYDIAQEDLLRLRKIAPVKTMAMHGNPLTPYDNRDLWKKYDYDSLGIEIAAYFTIDYSALEYFTDTGRNWDESRGNLYDTVAGQERQRLKGTLSLIEYLSAKKPNCCISTHPHRWTNNPFQWTYNAMYDHAGNMLKSIIKRSRHGK